MQHIIEFIKSSHSLDNIFSKHRFLFATCYYSLRNEMRKPSFGTWRLQNVRNKNQFICLATNSHENIANRPTYLHELAGCVPLITWDNKVNRGKYIITCLYRSILNQSRQQTVNITIPTYLLTYLQYLLTLEFRIYL